MPKSIPAILNPPLLLWAREQAGLSLHEAASRAKRQPGELQAWEQGKARPTLRQAENLAKIYHCSYSIFTLQSPPQLKPLATEYRRLPGVTPGKESPELRVALRDLLYRRRIALNLLGELGQEPKPFALKASLTQNPEQLGTRIRQKLAVTLQSQFAWNDDSQAWKAWRNAVESSGVLVLLFSSVDPEEVRGVSLLERTMPVIGVNNHEVRPSRPFTLMHEFVHLLLSNGNEELPASEESRTKREWNSVERFSEHVASAILMPQEPLTADTLVSNHSPAAEWSIEDITRLAGRYKVTPLAMATRLMVLRRMTLASYRRWRQNWNAILQQNPPKKPFGFATPAEKALNRNGSTFTTLVLEAMALERITPVDASQYLKISFPHIEELRLFFAFGRPLRQHQGA